MKKRIAKAVSLLSSNQHQGKKIMLSVVALLLVVCSLISVSYAWVETVSSIRIYTDTDTSANYADMKYKITNEVDYSSVKVTGNTELDLAEFFKKSGNMHFTPASSVNGKDFFFPKTRYSGGNVTFFRKGDVSDRNVNFLSICLKVTTDSVTGAAFYFNNNSVFFDDNHMRISVSSKVDGTDTEETKIFANSSSAGTANVVAAVDGTPASTVVYPISDYYNSNSNAGNKTLLSLEKDQTKIVTINIWYQYDSTVDASSFELSSVLNISNLKIICKEAPKRVTFIPTGLWTDISGIWFAAWVYDNSAGLADSWVSVSDNGDGSYTCEFDSTYRKLVFARFQSTYTTPSFNTALNQTVDITIGDNAAATYFINGLSNTTYTRQLDNTTQKKYAFVESQPTVVYLDFVTGSDDQSYGKLKLSATNHNMNIEKTYTDVTNNMERFMLLPGEATISLSVSDLATNYVLEGWYSDKAGTNQLTGTALTKAPAAGEVRTYYAKFETTPYYLGGWLNGAAVDSDHAYKFTKESDTIYTLTRSFTSGTDQYPLIYYNGKSYRPASNNDGSGTVGSESNNISPSDTSVYKWKVDAGASTTVKFTWDTTDNKLYWDFGDTDYYLAGNIDNSNITVKNDTYKLVEQPDGTFMLSDYTFTGGTAQTFTVIAENNNVYHPASDNAGSGTAAARVDGISTANSSNKWKLDVPAGVTADITWDPSTMELSWTSRYTIYFSNTKSWENVYIYLNTSAFWDSLGAKPKNAAVKDQMTYDSVNEVYKYTVEANGTVPQYSAVAFCKDNQDTYDNFYNTDVSYRTDHTDYTKPKFTPNATSNETLNDQTHYYNNGSWSAL